MVLSHSLTLSHSHTLSISHWITLDMLNNFCFHLYAQKSLSHSHTLMLSLSHTLSLSHSFNLSFTHSRHAEQVLFSSLGSKVAVYRRKLQCFFLTAATTPPYPVTKQLYIRTKTFTKFHDQRQKELLFLTFRSYSFFRTESKPLEICFVLLPCCCLFVDLKVYKYSSCLLSPCVYRNRQKARAKRKNGLSDVG